MESIGQLRSTGFRPKPLLKEWLALRLDPGYRKLKSLRIAVQKSDVQSMRGHLSCDLTPGPTCPKDQYAFDGREGYNGRWLVIWKGVCWFVGSHCCW